MLLYLLAMPFVLLSTVPVALAVRGKCPKGLPPLAHCPPGLNFQVYLSAMSWDSLLYAPFHIPDKETNWNLLKLDCWKMFLHCSEQTINVTVQCLCHAEQPPKGSSESASLPGITGMEELPTAEFSWDLEHLKLLIRKWPDGSDGLELFGCRELRNGSFLNTMMTGNELPSANRQRISSSTAAMIGELGCNFVNEQIFQRTSSGDKLKRFLLMVCGTVGLICLAIILMWVTLRS